MAGHSGLLGTVLLSHLATQGYTNLLTRTHEELDLTNQTATFAFLAAEKPATIIICAAKAGGYRGQQNLPGFLLAHQHNHPNQPF